MLLALVKKNFLFSRTLLIFYYVCIPSIMSYKFTYSKSDSEELRLSKRLIFLIALFCTICGLVWAGMFYLAYGFCLTVILPLSFAAIVGTSILIAEYFKNYLILVYAQLTCITWIGAAIQWSIGSVDNSGMVVWWCFLGPTGALLFLKAKKAMLWCAQFLLIILITILVEPALSGKILHTPEGFKQLFYTMNMAIPALIVFAVSYYFQNGRSLLAKKNKTLLKETASKNQEILSSINYAKRLQKAIMPSDSDFKKALKDAFVLFEPKDIISGDFYWIENRTTELLFAVADCTGHGVPASIVSVVCHGALNRSVREFGLTNPNEILDKTREIILQEFEKSDEDIQDGMDIALCRIKNKTLYYSGAYQSLIILRESEIIELKGDRQPVGKYYKYVPFTLKEFELQTNDLIYLFSDGFIDQFGGHKEKKRKYKSSRLKKALIEMETEPMVIQKEILLKIHNDWKKEIEQTDDICFVGIRI